MATDPDQAAAEAPPRRSGRGAGYEHRPRLLEANRMLGAALSKLARDQDLGSRQVGAEIAAMVAELVEQAATAADASTTRARRLGDQVATLLPRLERQLAEAEARVRHLRESVGRQSAPREQESDHA